MAQQLEIILVKINEPEFMNIPPLGLLYVGNALKKAGYKVQVLHISTEQVDEYVEKVIETAPIYVGFSVFTGTSMRAYADMCRKIKKSSDIPIVWGNAHPSLLPEQCLEETYIDYVVIGEGEVTAVELAQAINTNDNFNNIKGLGFKSSNGDIQINKRRGFINNLDDYSLNWDLVNIEDYIKPYWELDRVLQFVTSRGCPHNCGFCYNQVFNSRRFRAHSAGKVISEINQLKRKYDLQGIFFWDDNFFADKKRAFEIVSKINLPYYAESRLDYIDEDFAKKLAETRCRYLLTGAESGSDRILKLINKGATVADTLRATKILSKYPSVRMSPSIIFAVPTETREEYYRTIKMIVDMFEINKNLTFTTGFYLPYPGTDLYDLCRKMGFAVPDKTEDWADLDRWTNKMETTWIDWGSTEEFAKMRRRIGVLGTLYRYNIPVFKRLIKWRLLNNFYLFEIDIALILFIKDIFISKDSWISKIARFLLKKYWRMNKTFSKGEGLMETRD